MMAQLIDRKHLKQEMKELLRSAQVSPRGRSEERRVGKECRL